MKRAAIIAALLSLVAAAAPAFGQGCIMCYEGARGASVGSQQALSNAVLVLLVPPVLIMGLIVGFAFRYAKKREQQQEAADAFHFTHA